MQLVAAGLEKIILLEVTTPQRGMNHRSLNLRLLHKILNHTHTHTHKHSSEHITLQYNSL